MILIEPHFNHLKNLKLVPLWLKKDKASIFFLSCYATLRILNPIITLFAKHVSNPLRKHFDMTKDGFLETMKRALYNTKATHYYTGII